VILGATMTESALDEVLDAATDALPGESRAHFKNTVDRLNFANKVQWAYLLRGISTRELRALNVVKDMRNDFAHEIVSFSDDKIIAKSSELEELLEFAPHNAIRLFAEMKGTAFGHVLSGVSDSPLVEFQRLKFLLSVFFLNSVVLLRSLEIEAQVGKPPLEEIHGFEELKRRFGVHGIAMEGTLSAFDDKG
jgi:hypothetical protein